MVTQIRFKRDAAVWQDKLRSYRILIDGKDVGSIGERAQVDVQVGPGKKKVQFKIDWCTSPVIEVNVQAGATETVTCGPNSHPLLALLYVTFLRKRYIWAKHGASAA